VHDEALNWDDPSGDLIWDNLCDELDADYEIEFYEYM
jgi:hypothetical protein